MNFQDIETEIWEKTKGIEGWNSEDKCATIVAVILGFKPKHCVELGVFAAKSLSAIALALQVVNEGGRVIGIDSWSTADNVAAHDQQNAKEWWFSHGEGPGSILDQRRLEAYQWVESLGIEEFVEIREQKIDDALNDFPDNSIDLLHLDAGKSYDDSNRHTEAWIPKVKVGGIIVYDDVDWRTARTAYMKTRQRCRVLFEILFRGEQSFAILQREK